MDRNLDKDGTNLLSEKWITTASFQIRQVTYENNEDTAALQYPDFPVIDSTWETGENGGWLKGVTDLECCRISATVVSGGYRGTPISGFPCDRLYVGDG